MDLSHGTCPTGAQAELVRRFTAEALPLLASGAVRVLVHKVYSGLAACAEAHALMETNETSGKIIIALTPEASAV